MDAKMANKGRVQTAVSTAIVVPNHCTSTMNMVLRSTKPSTYITHNAHIVEVSTCLVCDHYSGNMYTCTGYPILTFFNVHSLSLPSPRPSPISHLPSTTLLNRTFPARGLCVVVKVVRSTFIAIKEFRPPFR